MQDGNWNVQAAKDTLIETVSNPTLFADSGNSNKTFFNSYGEDASVNAASLNGNVTFAGPKKAFFPSKLKITAFNGDIEVISAKLLPAAQGDLKLLAANNLTLGNITVSDAAVNTIASASKPIRADDFSVRFNSQVTSEHDPQLLHKNDAEPVLIIAKNGDISGVGKVTTPKVTKVMAGGNIKDVQFNIQNNRPSDISLIKAGNDVGVGNVVVGGPGELLVQAGRNIDLTKTVPKAEIISTGNTGYKIDDAKEFFKTANPALPKDGASITLQAGLGKDGTQPNVQNYIEQYILPTGSGPITLKSNIDKMATYRADTAKTLTVYMQKVTGNAALNDAQALVLFNASSSELKTIFVNRHLSSELLASAQDFAKTKSNERGDNAYKGLFPVKNQGDILIYSNKVATNNAGNIDLLAPGGSIVVGIGGVAFKNQISKKGAIGVITEKNGAIRAIANNNILVNQSKLITQFGSDIALYSDQGNVDAGAGSKSATSIPERIVSTDKDGNTIIDIRGVATGSGIRAQSYDPDGPNKPLTEPAKGKVFLGAPRGYVNAGEAGIEAGNLLVVAPIVLNADNIQVQGSSVGVPIAAAVAPAGLGATSSPDSVKSAVAAVAESVAQSASKPFAKPVLPSIISVDIISIGK